MVIGPFSTCVEWFTPENAAKRPRSTRNWWRGWNTFATSCASISPPVMAKPGEH